MAGAGFANPEFGAELAYLRQMAAAAQARSMKVALLFLPYYGEPSTVQERAFYEQYGLLRDSHFAADHDEWFADVAHLNHDGTLVVSD